MMREKKKRRMNTKEKSILKRKWETDRLKMNRRGKRSKKEKKTNLTTCSSKRSRKKSPLKNWKWEIVRKKSSTDSSKLWRKTKKTKEGSDNRRKDKDLRYFFYSISGHQNAIIIRQAPGRTWEKAITVKAVKRRKDQACYGIICWFSHQGSKVTNQTWGSKDAQAHLKSTQEGKGRGSKKG